MIDALLPSEFSELEPFAAKWCLATEQERYMERLSSSMTEMQALYDAVTARAEAVSYTHLDVYKRQPRAPWSRQPKPKTSTSAS